MALGSSKRPAVRVTINGYTYRSSLALMGGKFMLPISAEHRLGAGVRAGDKVEIDIELDTEPRTVTIPSDLADALDQDVAARQYFERLAYSHRLRYVLSIEQARTAETRQRRIDKTISLLHEGLTT